MALCLNQLIENKKSSPFLLINDSVQSSALPLLAEFAFTALRDEEMVIAIMTETSPLAWIDRISSLYNVPLHKLHIIDAYTDPFGWDGTANDPPMPPGIGSLLRVRNLKQMEESILASVIQKAHDQTECCILFDSLHPFLLVSKQRTYQMIKTLESLTADTLRLVVGYHADTRLPSEARGISTADALNRLASVVIALEALPEQTNDPLDAFAGFAAQQPFSYMNTMSNRFEKGGLARIEWRKKSGKVQYTTEGYYLGSKGLIVVPSTKLTGERPEATLETEDAVPQQSDPMTNLSFNLSLTDDQRRAKDNVVLPYMNVQQQDHTQHSTGTIYYEPDAGDDFDDEDPDEDLDI
ncbi:Elongator complex protein 5 [Dichotomocladium elegans]|nr:Elongator complex protein 5 [Dichotomocladium elegans]